MYTQLHQLRVLTIASYCAHCVPAEAFVSQALVDLRDHIRGRLGGLTKSTHFEMENHPEESNLRPLIRRHVHVGLQTTAPPVSYEHALTARQNAILVALPMQSWTRRGRWSAEGRSVIYFCPVGAVFMIT